MASNLTSAATPARFPAPAPTPAARKVEEGFIPFRGHRVWYRIVGTETSPTRPPLLCLHGGPGVPHDYLESIEALADSGRCVVFYDQLGCGNWDQPHDPSLWTVDLFVDEVQAIRRALALERVHLLGQSWGGMLAMEYALRQPRGLCSLVLANAPASFPQFVAGTRGLRAQLPQSVQDTLSLHEAAGTFDDPAYQGAVMTFYQKHLCRLNPWPDGLSRAFGKVMANPEVYATMNGPSEFHVVGTLKDWDIVPRLPEIRVPTLVIAGRYDEVTPEVMRCVQRGIAGSEWLLFEHSSHMPHYEEEALFMDAVGAFLRRVESGAV